MKKTVIGLSLLLSGLFAGTATAQTPAAAQKVTAKTEQACPKPQDCRKADRPCPFDKVTGITAEQKSKLQAIAPCDGKECRQQGRKEYLENVKKILTPEQYVEFLEITYINRGGDRPGIPRKMGKDGAKARQAKLSQEGSLSNKAQ